MAFLDVGGGVPGGEKPCAEAVRNDGWCCGGLGLVSRAVRESDRYPSGTWDLGEWGKGLGICAVMGWRCSRRCGFQGDPGLASFH